MIIVDISMGKVHDSFEGTFEECLSYAERWLERQPVLQYDTDLLRECLLNYKLWKQDHYHPDHVIQIIEPRTKKVES